MEKKEVTLDKDIKNLQKDIYHVLNTGEGYTKEIADWVGEVLLPVFPTVLGIKV